MIVEVTLADRLIAAYIEGYVERYVETHGRAPHSEDVAEVTQEAIHIYSGGISPSLEDRYDHDVDELMM